jgi:nicotinamidase-related amidase
MVGLTGDQCVLTTAMDAHMRDYRLWVPRDAVASVTPQRNQRALDYLSEVVGVRVQPVEGAR